MRIHVFIPLILLWIFAPAAHGFDGPLQVRNQFPLFLGMLPPSFESAGTGDSFTLGLHHSSTYLTETTELWGLGLDLEMTGLDMRFRKRAGSGGEIGIDVPVVRPSGGFFDSPLGAWHDLLGVGDYGRRERPDNAFLYRITYRGIPLIEGVNDRAGFGDVRMSYKRLVHSTETSTVSVMGTVELPAGDAETGYGNGSIDGALAVLADMQWGGAYRGYGNVGYVVPGDLRAKQTVPLRNFLYAGIGVEAAWAERMSVLAQVMAQQSPLPDTGTHHVDRPAVLVSFGGRYYGRSGSLEVSVSEDASVAGAPDFIANMAWKMRY